MRFTRAASGGPPQPSIVAVAPTCTLTASEERSSTETSSSEVLPISISGVPMSTVFSLSAMSLKTRPDSGDFTS